MSFRTAFAAATLLSLACASNAAAQERKVEAAPLPSNRPPLTKKVIGKCVRRYTSRESPSANELQAGLQAPLVAQVYSVVRDWVFSNSVQEPRGGVVDCMYKLVTPSGAAANDFAIYSFNCKGAQKQSEDTWSCEL